MKEPSCERAAWDSDFFGIAIGRVLGDRLTPGRIALIDAWVAQERIACLYFLCDPSCPASSRIAEDSGFRLTDIRVTLCLATPCPPPAPHPAIRPAVTTDAGPLIAIARDAHTDSRFFHDGRFATSACRALYETWIRRSLEGWADAVLVAETEDGPVGYITCHRDDQGGGSIGLIGVADRAQGRGLGPQLVGAARTWFADHAARPVTVVTQGRNLRAQRLYHRAGFLPSSAGLWFHRWHDVPGDPRT